MQDILIRDLPLVPIAEVRSELAVRKGITDWAGHGLDLLLFWYFEQR
jgi:hypothetical protein